MRVKLASGIGLLAWQAFAALASFTATADLMLARVGDPAWWAALCASALNPPGWVTALALFLAAVLLVWDRKDRGNRGARRNG